MKIKSVVCALLSILFLFFSVTIVTAADESEMDQVLVSRGYPQYVLNTLCDEVKKELFHERKLVKCCVKGWG